MKYDLSKCNNLRWTMPSRKDERIILNGVVKLENDSFSLCRDDKEINPLSGAYLYTIEGSGNIEDFYKIFREEDFSIIPRDPNIYNDWQVGDTLKVIDTCQGGQVMALCGRMVAIKWIGKNAIEWLLRSWVNENCELRLTDYEKYIRDLKEETKPVCNFKEGDKVLVRNLNSQEWGFIVYSTGCKWKQCIPLNEHTWHLLGTKDAYEEDKEC